MSGVVESEACGWVIVSGCDPVHADFVGELCARALLGQRPLYLILVGDQDEGCYLILRTLYSFVFRTWSTGANTRVLAGLKCMLYRRMIGESLLACRGDVPCGLLAEAVSSVP